MVAVVGRVPTKVSVENGAIRVGDSLTSSTKPGIAMKATQGGKIIGYALQDADKDGKILVWLQVGDNTAAEVAALRAQVQELQQQLHQVLSQVQAMQAHQKTVSSK